MPEDARPAASSFDHVPAGELDAAPLRLAVSPLPTTFTLTRDALQGGRRGTPAVWRKSVLSHLKARDVAVFAPMTDPKTTGWPTLLDEVSASHETIDEALQRVAATPGSTLLEALEEDRDVTPIQAWDAVRRDPERWLAGYVDATHRGWRAIEPLWRRSAALIEREEERVEAALDRGVSTALMVSQTLPRVSLVDDELRLATSEPRRLTVDDSGVTITPMIAGPSASTLISPGDAFRGGAYPLRETWRAFDDQVPPPPSLQALLGRTRTAMLQRLDTPQRAGQLAEVLALKPSAITFHMRALEAAGLICRRRRGRSVIVRRTSRGTQLLALYSRS